MMATAGDGVKGGYDVPFVDPLDKDYECPICLLALKDPVQTPCGHSFCKTCFNQVAGQQGGTGRGRVQCPIDKRRISLSQVFSDVKVKRKVLSLSVECQNVLEDSDDEADLPEDYEDEADVPQGSENESDASEDSENESDVPEDSENESDVPEDSENESDVPEDSENESDVPEDSENESDAPENSDLEDGICGWVGALSDYQHHLTRCKYQTVRCDDCGMAMKRCQLHYHKRSVCDRRIVICKFCEDPFEQRGLQVHRTVCPRLPVLCPLRCGEKVERKNVDDHVNESGNCPNTLINCPFKDTGCDVRCKRHKLPDHLTTNVVEHQIKQQQMMIKQQQIMKRLSDENAELKRRLELVGSSVTCLSRNVGHLFMLPSQCKLLSRGQLTIRFKAPFKGCDRNIESSSFMIYPTGYKAKVVVDRDVDLDDTTMSVAIRPTRGDIDDQLSWPFKIRHTITIINQRDHGINGLGKTIDPANLDAAVLGYCFSNPSVLVARRRRLQLSLKDTMLTVSYVSLFNDGFVKDGNFYVTVEVDDN